MHSCEVIDTSNDLPLNADSVYLAYNHDSGWPDHLYINALVALDRVEVYYRCESSAGGFYESNRFAIEVIGCGDSYLWQP